MRASPTSPANQPPRARSTPRTPRAWRVDKGEASARDWAYLVDRIATAEQRKQTYGTQFVDLEPSAIEDEAHVDERRREVGLAPMVEYREQIRKLYGPKH